MYLILDSFVVKFVFVLINFTLADLTDGAAFIAAGIMIILIIYLFLERVRCHGREQDANDLLIQNERYKILEETSNDFLFVYYPEVDKFCCSQKLPDGRLVRAEKEAFLRKGKFEDYIHKDYIDLFETNMKEMLRNERDVNFDILLHILSQKDVWCRVFLKSVLDSRGKVISVVGRAENIHEMMVERNQALKIAETDIMTGVYNKMKLKEKIEQHLSRQGSMNTALLIIDLDDFKKVNDTYGHAFGDEKLLKAVMTLNHIFQEEGLIGRFGGDEFAVFLPNITKEKLRECVRRFQNMLKQEQLSSVYKITCSLGGAYALKNGCGYEKLFCVADESLYAVKHEGKNDFLLQLIP